MSRRPSKVDCSSPNIVIIPTIIISDNDESSPPPKKPNLIESSQPPVPQEVQVTLDSIPVPPPPLPKAYSVPKVPSKNSETVLQSVNVNPIKTVLSMNTNKHPIVSKCDSGVKKSLETQESEVKNSTRRPSWATNYLKSIGLAYNKPIKVNLTSSNKKFNVGLEELNQSKSTEDDDSKDVQDEKNKKIPAKLPADEKLVSMTTTFNKEVNKSVLFPEPNLEIKHPEISYAANDVRAEKCVPFATQSVANKPHVSIINASNSEVINKSIIHPQPDFEIRHPEMYTSRDVREECIIFPTQSLANETLVSMSYPSHNEVVNTFVINPQPYFETRHPEMLYINEHPFCTNFCTNFQNQESMFTTNTFMGYDNLKTNATFDIPGEDKFYLDEVDQFLSKISQNSPYSHGYDCKKIDRKTRTRSLSLKKRDVSHIENPQRIKTNTKIRQNRDDTRISERESMRMEGTKKRYDTERDGSRQLYAERHKARPSTSKKDYNEKEHSENQNSDMPKVTFKCNKLIEESKRREIKDKNNVRNFFREFCPDRPTVYAPNPSLMHMTTHKRRHSSDSSSSEFVRKSYQDESRRKLSKRQRSNSSTCSENNLDSKIIGNEKPTAKGDLDSSDSSDCSMPCCSRKIKHTTQSERSKNSSNSIISRHCSPQHEQISGKSKLHIENDRNGSTQKIKQHKSRQDRSRSSSGETRSHGSPQLAQRSKLPTESDRDVTLLKIKQHKSRRDRSKSSSGSDTRRHGSTQHAHKNKLLVESGRDESPHKSQKIKQHKSRRDRSKSSSGSETRRRGSPQHAHKNKLLVESGRDESPHKSQKIKQHKSRRDRSKSSSGSETRGHGSAQHAHKNKLLVESGRDESPHKSQKIKHHKSRRDRSKSSSGSETRRHGSPQHAHRRYRSKSSSGSETRRHGSPQHAHKNKLLVESGRDESPHKSQKIKRHKSRRDKSNSNKSEKCQTKKTKKSKKSKRERSNSSSNSKICLHNMPSHVHQLQENKKIKRSSSGNNPDRSRSPHTYKNREKLEKQIKSKSSNSSHKSTESYKSEKVTKDVICKDKNKKTVIKSFSTCKKPQESSKKDDYEFTSTTTVTDTNGPKSTSEFACDTNGPKSTSEFATTMYSFEETSYFQAKTKESAAIKSVVQIKEHHKSHYNTRDTENFDLRSKLTRRGLGQYFGKISKTENKTDERENLRITVPNEDEENITIAHEDETKQKILNTARDKLIKLSQKRPNNANNKKRKKFKLVINVICNSSQSSDSDDIKETTCKISDKKLKDESTVMKKVITENNISNELSFLDDINIDEIVESLTCNQNESCSSKNTTNAAITVSSSSPEIDTYLVSDSEHSDASTVHLEELLETHDNLKAVENNNTNPQSQRILMTENKLNTEETNINMTIKSEREESDQKVMISENEIKKEINEDGNHIILLSNDKLIDPRHDNIKESVTNKEEINKVTFIHNTSFIDTGKQEPVYKVVNKDFKILDAKRQEVQRFPNSKQVNITNTQGTSIPLYKVKDDHTDKENDEVKKHEHKKDCNLIPTSYIKDAGGKVRIDRVKLFDNRNKDIILKHEIEESEDFLPNNGLVTERKKEVNNCNLFLESPESEPALPPIPPNKIKEEMPSEVPKEISVENEQDVLKNNAKKSSQLGDSKKKPETEIIPSIEIKIEAEVGRSVINNLSTSVGDSESVLNIIKQSKVGSNDKNDTNQISSKCSIKQTNKAIVEKSLKSSKSVNFAHNVQDIKEEPSSDTESATSLISVFSTTNAPVCKSSDKVNFEEVTDESLNSEMNGKENMSDKHLKTAIQNVQQIEDTNDSNTAELASSNKINCKAIKHEEARNIKQMPSNNNAINGNKEVLDNTNKKTKANNSSDQIEIRTCTIKFQNMEQVNKASNLNTQFPACSEKYLKDEVSQNFAQTQSNNNVMKGNEEASDNTDLKIKATNSYSEIEKTTDITEGQNLEQIKKTNGSDTRDPASSEKENSEKNEVEKSQDVESMKFNNNDIKCDEEVAVKIDMKPKATNSSVQIQINNEQQNMKRSENDNVTTIFKSITTGTELKTNEHTESKTAVSKNIQSDNLKKQNVAGLNDGQNLRIESERNKVSDNKNDNLQNKKIATDSGKNIYKQLLKPTPNVIKKDNLPNKDSATKSLGHSSNIRAMPTQSTIKTENLNRSVELVLSPSETTLMKKLEDRLSNYLREQYRVDSILHRGRFSKIFKCSDSKGQNYVAKITSRNPNTKAKEKMLASLQKDIPDENLHFIRFINGLEISGQWCFIMEFYPKNLIQVLKENNKSLHISTVQLLSKQLVTAVTVLRHHKIVHSDIKPHHILLNNTNDRLKLCGFDGAYYNEKPGLLQNVSTVNYRAPEILLGYSSGYSIDVWSTALVMYEMATRRQLFPGQYNNDILYKQMCTLSFIPNEMIRNSSFAYKHFQGNVFMRRKPKNRPPLGQNIVSISEHQICRNTILKTTIRSTYSKEWGRNIPLNQKREELVMLESFIQLLQQMLVVHPHFRLPIESAYAHPFLFDYND